MAFGHPEDLHVMRAGDESDAGFGAGGGGGFAGWLHADPVFVGRFGFFIEGEADVVVREDDVVEIGLDGFAGGDLGHGAVVGAMPGGVFVLVAFDAGLGTDVGGGAEVRKRRGA